VEQICETYLNAPELAAEGAHVISTDEKTGMQALERRYETKNPSENGPAQIPCSLFSVPLFLCFPRGKVRPLHGGHANPYGQGSWSEWNLSTFAMGR
jgi:hypothetical protein